MDQMIASRVQEASRKKPRLAPRDFCPHCDQSLSRKTFKKHKALYCMDDGSWIKDTDESTTSATEVLNQPPDLPIFDDNDCEIEHGMENAMCPDSDSESETGSHEDGADPEIWEDDDDDDFLGDIASSSNAPSLPAFNDPCQKNIHAILMWIVGFLLNLQAKYYIPDASINLLIRFFHAFISVTGHFSEFMKGLARVFPTSLTTLLALVKSRQSFTKYVVCCKCHKLYNYDSCREKVGSITVTKNCENIAFPYHPHHSKRQPCNNPLLKSVEVRSGNVYLYPYKIYCYTSLISLLQEYFRRPCFYQQCQHWKSRSNDPSLIKDVYDGQLWKEFHSLFMTSLAVGLMLNIDWFQPYTHTTMSVGVIYLTIMNLPRHIRSKRENILLLGIIPGPDEPKHDINAYLGPLVEELLLLWNGVSIEVALATGIKEMILKGVLLCASCDLPAARKTCGFLSHSAALGCSKCFTFFPGEVGGMNYSGFNCQSWPKRTNDEHRKRVEEVMKCTSRSTQLKKERELGCRYSALLDLPYFDPVRMHSIDPMHNLFLGSGKHMMTIWQSKSLVLPHHYDEIQKFVDSISVPSDVGRIPLKIGSGFSGFKADQFKNWINIYSIPSLFGILPSESLECWRHFVLACRILCKHSLSTHDLDLAHLLLLQFCRKVEQLYGESVVTPNMHLHAHLKDVIHDYGPVQEFWCFSFERFNGILGKQPTNNRSIEAQLMKKFMRDHWSSSFEYPDLFQDDFTPIVSSCTSNLVGSLSETMNRDRFELGSKYVREVLSPDAIDGLSSLLRKSLFISSAFTINTIFMKYTSITLKGKVFSSAGRRSSPVVVMVTWDEDIYGKPPTTLPDPDLPNTNIRPVNVHYYAKVLYTIDDIAYDTVLAYVSWFFPHPHRYALGKPVELWCKSIYEPVDFSCSFVPLQNIQCRCAHGVKEYQHEHLLMTIPLVE